MFDVQGSPLVTSNKRSRDIERGIGDARSSPAGDLMRSWRQRAQHQ